MTFAEIAQILGRDLPQSAYRHRPWWANEATGHSHAKTWLKAGYETSQVDMARQKLVFRRATPDIPAPSSVRGLSERARDFRPKEAVPSLFGALEGTFTIEPGWDLSNPALDPADIADLEAGIECTAMMADQGLKVR